MENHFPSWVQNSRFKMEPNLLMRAWMMAHVYGAKYQAAVCMCGSGGEAAFRESLRPQYTSSRHDVKGLRTYYITGSCGGDAISRVTSGYIGSDVIDDNDRLCCLTVTSNTHTWQRGDLDEEVPYTYGFSSRRTLVHLILDVERIAEIPPFFLGGKSFECIDLAPLQGIVTIPSKFLFDCNRLRELDLTPLVNVKVVGKSFLREVCQSEGYKPQNAASYRGCTRGVPLRMQRS